VAVRAPLLWGTVLGTFVWLHLLFCASPLCTLRLVTDKAHAFNLV